MNVTFQSHVSATVWLLLVLFILSIAGAVQAQTTSFTYQGRLQVGGTSANGSFDLQFALFDSLSAGSQVGSTQTISGVAASNGTFTVTLDFGASAFPGANRWLEISVRTAGGGSFTLLTPRQSVTPTPYAIKSLNATAADGLSAACINCVSGSQIGSLPGGSGNYLQNTLVQQAGSNFNISGNGTAAGILSGDTVNAATQYNIGGARVLSNPGSLNFFVGQGTGQANTSGQSDSFFGVNAGQKNTSGFKNSFFGADTGAQNTTGFANAFFGTFAGTFNTTGISNTFLGDEAGSNNTTGGANSFSGALAGEFNKTGSDNSFFGNLAGQSTTASKNSFFGSQSGQNNTTASFNTFIGYNTASSHQTGDSNTALGFNVDVADGIANATAIGANASVATSNTMVLGTNAVTVQVPGNLTVVGTLSTSIVDAATQYNIGGVRVFKADVGGNANTFTGVFAGGSNTPTAVHNSFYGYGAGFANDTGGDNAFFGYLAGDASKGFSNSFFGSFAGVSNTTGSENSFFGRDVGSSNTTGSNNAFFGRSAGGFNTTGTGNAFFGRGAGQTNVSGINNAFFGDLAGSNNTASGNSFFGAGAGQNNTTGVRNAFFGNLAGTTNDLGSDNSFFGLAAGASNTSGARNAFFGTEAGQVNTTGTNNSFLGYFAGLNNTTGDANAFFGTNAGTSNTTANSNSFVGHNAGANNTTASDNSFVGYESGFHNSTGTRNSFFGSHAGFSNTTGDPNGAGSDGSFFGYHAGLNSTGGGNSIFGSLAGVNNTTGFLNTFVGYGAGNPNGTQLSNAAAIGAQALVTQSNSIVLGSINGLNGAAADTNVGVGTTAPQARLQVAGGSICAGPFCDGGANRAGRVIAAGASAEFTFLDLSAASFVDVPANGERWVWYGLGGRARLWSGADKLSLDPAGNLRVRGTVTSSTTPDIAETIPADSPVTAADVVCADPAHVEQATRCSQNARAILGVISDGSGGFLINSNAKSPDAPLTGKPLVLAGRVPVKVSLENGPIQIGDLLAPSSTPGVAMRAHEIGPTVGVALEAFTDTATPASAAGQTGTVLCFVHVGEANTESAFKRLSEENKRLQQENVLLGARLDRLERLVAAPRKASTGRRKPRQTRKS